MTRHEVFSAALPLTLLLAACSGGSDDAAAPDPSETMMPVEPDGGIGDGAGPPQPVSADEIPADFRGVWDYVDSNCSPNSDLRVKIGAGSMQFYESHGEVTRIEVDSPQVIVVTLAMEGEGEQWEMKRKFTLSDDGQALTPTAVDEDRFEPMPLKKCSSGD